MAHQCNFCSATIATEDINVASDIALCRSCGKSMQFSSLAGIPGADQIDFTRPPKGVSVIDSPFHGRVLSYHKKSLVVLFLIPFTLLWSGFSMVGIYGSQIASGEFDPKLSLFGLPFLIGTVVLVSIIAFLLFGRTKVWFERGECRVYNGVGRIGWTRKHLCSPATTVALRMSNVRVNNVQKTGIELKTDGNTLMFGTMWSDDAKAFVATAMKRALQSASSR